MSEHIVKSVMIGFIKRNKRLLSLALQIKGGFIVLKKMCWRRMNDLKLEGVTRSVRYDILGKGNRILIAQGSVLVNCTIYIRGAANLLFIGENCRLKDSILWLEGKACEINISSSTTVEGAHFAATESTSISIGEDCMISNQVTFRTGDSHSVLDIETGKRINPAIDINIGRHVWIGANSTILKGVTIGEKSVIATGSVVTRDVESNTIVAGTPAKTVRTGVTWSRERL